MRRSNHVLFKLYYTCDVLAAYTTSARIHEMHHAFSDTLRESNYFVGACTSNGSQHEQDPRIDGYRTQTKFPNHIIVASGGL